jgi:SAM-dependent methyltransferase
VAQPALGLSNAEWQALQPHLITLGYFAQIGDRIAPTPEGKGFLVSLSEIYRGDQRLSQYEPVMRYLRDAPRGAAVDIGCGAGYMLKHLALLGYSPLYGYDLVPISLEIAQAGVTSVGQTAVLYAHDATTLAEIGDGALAMIFSRVALHYFDLPKFAHTMRRVLAPGGYVVCELVGLRYYLQTKHYQDWRPRRWRKMLAYLMVIGRTALFEVLNKQWRWGAKTPEIGWTRHSIRRIAQQSGLTIIEISPAPTTVGYFVVLQKKA